MDKHIAVLWSGGFDSTVMTYLIASKGYSVKPYHILIRNGGGKDAREKQAIQEIWPNMKNFYPNVEEPMHIKYQVKACDDRNKKLIELIRNQFGEKNIALGSYIQGSRFPEDNDKGYLSKITGCNIITFDTFNISNKTEIASLVKPLRLEEVIEKTWSCQLWFKKPCGKCFSCKIREESLKILKT